MQNRLLKNVQSTLARTNPDITESDFFTINYKKLIDTSKQSGTNYVFKSVPVYMLKVKYDECDSILMLFTIPMDDEGRVGGSKSLVEKIMEIIENAESTFVKIDFVQSTPVKEDSISYLLLIKKLEDLEEIE